MRFPTIYRALLRRLLNSEHTELNERTGVRVKVLPSGCSFVLDLSDSILPTPGYRKVYPYVSGAELAWFLSGERDVTWLNTYAPRIWSKFTEPGSNEVRNAYGYRWRHHFGIDQIHEALEALRRNPSDRRVFVSAWDPSEGDLGSHGKNVPCPVGFSFYVINDTIHASVFLRSLDTFVGLPYDVMDFALLLKAFAVHLNLRMGTLRTTAAHVHLYEDHWQMAADMMPKKLVEPDILMPTYSVTNIQTHKNDYVDGLKVMAIEHEWPSYAPIPEVIE